MIIKKVEKVLSKNNKIYFLIPKQDDLLGLKENDHCSYQGHFFQCDGSPQTLAEFTLVPIKSNSILNLLHFS